MQKLFSLLCVSVLVLSCRDIKKDTQAIADLKCISYSSEDSIEIKKYSKNIDEIKSHWKDTDLASLLKNSNDLFNKQCSAKIEDDKKIKELEEESKKFFEGYSSSYNDAINSVNNENFSEENYSTPYNGLEKFDK